MTSSMLLYVIFDLMYVHMCTVSFGWGVHHRGPRPGRVGLGVGSLAILGGCAALCPGT